MTSGEEKVHLVPVLTTILKLSPKEIAVLQQVASGGKQGDTSRASGGWSSYLPFK